MGVVYKAQDTKLDRTVALKFLAAHLLNDDEAKQRFLREAKAAAALHHPNICTVYEVDESDAKTFLAMAFLKGETLEDRIAQGPLAIKDALEIGRQVAEGLQAAHAEGVVHRDIKPANILVSPDGRATIMDFGLARLTEASRLTKAEQTVGTAAYMSPEQMQGGEVDHRTDVWALGCALYEMVAGVRPFKGEYQQALAYEIVSEEPEPLTAVRTGVPRELEFIVGKCLAKDAADRYQQTNEIAVDLRTLTDKLKSGRSRVMSAAELPATLSGTASPPPVAFPPDSVVVPRGRQRLLQALLAASALAVAALGWILLTQGPAEPIERPVRRFSFSPEGARIPRISPDGKNILYTTLRDGESSLWVRPLASENPRELAGTEGGIGGFWAPDSATIAFATQTELKRVSLAGAEAATLCKLPGTRSPSGGAFFGGAWSPDGRLIAFSSGGTLYEVPAVGGDPKPLFDPGARVAAVPSFLPSGNAAGALVYSSSASRHDSVVSVFDLESGEHRELAPGRNVTYSGQGYLLYEPPSIRDRGILALPFSVDALSAAGEAFPVVDEARFASVSDDGTLVYEDAPSAATKTLAWRDREGRLIERVGEPQPLLVMPSVSPDGSRVAVRSEESGNSDIWVYDLERSTRTRLTFDPTMTFIQPRWSRSGRDLVYEVRGPGQGRIETRSADGTGEATVLVESAMHLGDPSWSRDGRYLVYQTRNTNSDSNILYVEISAGGSVSEPRTFLGTPASERVPQLSPDGRFIAYLSDESGRSEVYVRPFPDGGSRWQASTDGGTQPLWNPDGTEIFYVRDNALMAVPVTLEPSFALGEPQLLFESPDLIYQFRSVNYGVSPDGRRFLTVAAVEDEDAPARSIHVVENWLEEFRDRE